jgi:hypothetical protein
MYKMKKMILNAYKGTHKKEAPVGWECSSAVEHLSSMYKAPSLNPALQKQTSKQQNHK